GPKVGKGLPGSASVFYVEASPLVVPYPHISNSLALALPDPNWVKEMELMSSCPSTSSFFGNYLEQVSSFNAIKPSIISSSSTSAPAEVTTPPSSTSKTKKKQRAAPKRDAKTEHKNATWRAWYHRKKAEAASEGKPFTIRTTKKPDAIKNSREMLHGRFPVLSRLETQVSSIE
ncbi:hypothetical protein Ocin01_14428, partial [Orchesella cincta]